MGNMVVEQKLAYPLSSNIMTHMVYVVKTLKSVLRQSGKINIAQYRTLGFLARGPLCPTPSGIAQALRLSPSSVAETLDSLSRIGYVAVACNADDRRRRVITLLPEGARALAEAERAAAGFVERLWRPLAAEHKRLMLEGCIKGDRLRGIPVAGADAARAILLYVENACIVDELMVEAVQRNGMSLNEFRVLFELVQGGRPQRSATLARKLLLRPNEVTKAASSLLARGQVDRRTDPHDQRSHLLAPTQQGVAVVDRVAPQVDATFCTGTYQTTPAERARYLEIADLVVGSLG